MLRECYRVLRPDGLLVVAAIELAPNLKDLDLHRALELGPADVHAEAALGEMLQRSGFELVIERDVTREFRVRIRQRLDALARNEQALRREEGDDVVHEEREKRARMLKAVNQGLLRRTIVVGRAEKSLMQTSDGVT